MKNPIYLLLSKLMACTLILGFSFSALANDKEENFSSVDTVNVKTISGDLKLVTSSSSEIEVSVTSTYDENKVQMLMEQSGSQLNLKEQHLRNGSSSGYSSWIVGIPEGMDIKVKYNSASGNLVATNLSIDLKVNTASGNITLVNFNGNVDGNTASGDIKLDNVSAVANLNTASGNITAAGGEGAFELSTASGDVEASAVTLIDSSSFSTASGDVEVSVNQTPSHDLKLSSASGNVDLNLQGNSLEGFISMSTKNENGYSIDAPFEFDNIETYYRHNDEYIKKTATLGDPNIRITLSTSSGDVKIND